MSLRLPSEDSVCRPQAGPSGSPASARCRCASQPLFGLDEADNTTSHHRAEVPTRWDYDIDPFFWSTTSTTDGLIQLHGEVQSGQASICSRAVLCASWRAGLPARITAVLADPRPPPRRLMAWATEPDVDGTLGPSRGPQSQRGDLIAADQEEQGPQPPGQQRRREHQRYLAHGSPRNPGSTRPLWERHGLHVLDDPH